MIYLFTSPTGILGESVTGDRYAVVVGISDYPGTANDLNYSDDDAQEMANPSLKIAVIKKGVVRV